jgi:hypothetical protein
MEKVASHAIFPISGIQKHLDVNHVQRKQFSALKAKNV